MHSDQEAVRKSVRTYMTVFGMLMVFTIVTVAVSRIHFAVPVAISIAMIIAAMKASMVAGVFMHLSHERQAIYGTLILTALFFLVLMLVPIFTDMNHIRLNH